MFRSLKLKFWTSLSLVHFGLFISVYGFYSLWRSGPMPQQFVDALPFLAFGVFTLYASVMGGLIWMYAPLAPWVRRARSFRHFKMWVLEELPTIIAVVTSLAALVPVLRATWHELKKLHETGKLDIKRFSHVARKFADKAEHVLDEEHQYDSSQQKGSNGSSRKVA